MFLSKIKTKKSLLKGFKKSYGRNNQGKITASARKKGHKRLYRNISNQPLTDQPGLIVNIEYDPNRSNFIAKVLTKQNMKYVYKYIPCTQTMNVLQYLKPVTHELKPSQNYNNGKTFYIKNLAIGDLISNIEKYPNQGPVFARSAGTVGQIINFNNKNDLVRIQLPSKEHYYILPDCKVSLGKNANTFHKYLQKWKAGHSSAIGKRAHTRGVAKNPVDHPHGGGEGKSSVGRQPVTPQGRLTRGVKTRKKKKNSFFIALHRRLNKKF